jgi:hypothetical protein
MLSFMFSELLSPAGQAKSSYNEITNGESIILHDFTSGDKAGQSPLIAPLRRGADDVSP